MEENKNSEEEKPAVGNEQLAKNTPETGQGEILPLSGEIIQVDETPAPEAKAASDEQPPTTNLSSEAFASEDNHPQTEQDMEVHHHTHASHGKKNWKSYFWEFLMLFLAVFCGFLAEYQLEHVIEHQREKQFIQTFIEDLKTDTAAIGLNITFRKKKREQMNSLMYLLSNQKIKGNENDLYYFGRMLIRNTRFLSNDRTIIQLKNSGSLRLIRNEEAADSMISYQNLVEQIFINQEDERAERTNVFPILSRLFNPFVFDKMVTINGINRPDNNPPLRSYDTSIQQDLAAYVHTIKGSTFIIESRLDSLNKKAKNIMNFLKKEYHLE